jgi:hypothetical protein
MDVGTQRTREVVVQHGIDSAGPAPVNVVSWGAIWAGFFVGLSAELIMTMLMLGVFGTTFLSVGGSTSGQSFGIGIAAWIFCETLVAYYAGGWVAGRLAPATRGVHGAAVWGLLTAALAFITVNGPIRGMLGVASAAAPATGAPMMQLAGWVLIYFFVVLILGLAAAVAGGKSAWRYR